VADGFDGVEIFDVSDPTNISLIANHFDGGAALDIDIHEHYAFVADGSDGLEILDLSTITNPVEIGSWRDSGVIGSAQQLYVHPIRNTIEIAYGSLGLVYLDITNYNNPSLLKNYYTASSATSVYSLNETESYYSWVTWGSSGVEYIIWQGIFYYDPWLIDNYNDGGIASSIMPFDEGFLVSDGFDGIEYLVYSFGSINKEAHYADGGWALQTQEATWGNDTVFFVADGLDGLEVIGIDTDNDCLADITERIIGTNETLEDTDNDSYFDGVEVYYGSDPLNDTSIPEIKIDDDNNTLPTIPTPTTTYNTNFSIPSNNIPGFTVAISFIGLSFSSMLFMIYSYSKKKNRD
jgi:hypothetical protein